MNAMIVSMAGDGTSTRLRVPPTLSLFCRL